MSEAVLVPMRDIILDDRLQPRQDDLSADHIASLMETPEAWPPIVLAQLDAGKFLIDGFHRHEAARQLGLEEMAASIFTPAAGADLLGIAFQLNVKHGRALTLRDRKAYASTLLRNYLELPDREIGRRSGLHHETVGALRNARLPSSVRKPGELPTDVGILDPIRFAKKATREQKAVAGYIQRLAIALRDPYDGTLGVWSENPKVIARACLLAMGAKRATQILTNLEADANFIIDVTQVLTDISEEKAQ
jgi:ParB-like chromosome segregation protein Spo0J